MADRRRVNGPAGATLPPVYGTSNPVLTSRVRPSNGIRGMFLKTGVAPTASGSAYMEIEPPSSQSSTGTKINGMKLICTVHGPRSLPRSAPFSPYLTQPCEGLSSVIGGPRAASMSLSPSLRVTRSERPQMHGGTRSGI
ncbi:Exosome complex component MTR3 [Colletotrichum orbiculare MAFF 240422]|uniref:Exosome complex component MTR3 n=1 Tax=Colletotrichum orbiculare (strain 104-T / ATCC 96160 / CBS 514.97 / LARS 414 / MAFF 240422) TaxID=1213857 RepID=A0A484G4F2_COLOR|nr:Exosome complex component MTR3 [Colletotrichum orbiculare MAFF 240422]